MSAEQARTFLASIAGDDDVPADRLEALYVLALTSGMRQGELLGLKWSGIDLEAGRLTVSHTLNRRTHELGEPKTKRARRTLHLSTLALEALKRHRTAQLEQRLKAGRKWIDNDYVFATRYGTPLEARNVSRSFARAIEAAGLPHQRFHDLRHASASIGLEGGESLVEVSHRLGHANLSTTGDVYSHISPVMQERSAARMDEALTG